MAANKNRRAKPVAPKNKVAAHIKVMSRPQKLFASLTLFLLTLAVLGLLNHFTLRLGESSAAAHPSVHIQFDFPANAAGYDSSEVTIRPKTSPYSNGYFWAYNVYLDPGDNSNAQTAYFGLQTQGLSNPSGKIALFSIFGATAAVGPEFTDHFSEGGGGYSARISYNWRSGRDFRFRVAKISGIQGSWWGAWVTNELSGRERFIGRIRVPDTWKKIQPSTIAFSEHYSPENTSCAGTQYAEAEFLNMTMNNNPAIKFAYRTPTYTYGDCKNNSLSRNISGGVSQLIGLNNSHATLKLDVIGVDNVDFVFDNKTSTCGARVNGPTTCSSTTASGSPQSFGTPAKPARIVPVQSTIPAGYAFQGWEGLCNGPGELTSCRFSIAANQVKGLRAIFVKK